MSNTTALSFDMSEARPSTGTQAPAGIYPVYISDDVDANKPAFKVLDKTDTFGRMQISVWFDAAENVFGSGRFSLLINTPNGSDDDQNQISRNVYATMLTRGFGVAPETYKVKGFTWGPQNFREGNTMKGKKLMGHVVWLPKQYTKDDYDKAVWLNTKEYDALMARIPKETPESLLEAYLPKKKGSTSGMQRRNSTTSNDVKVDESATADVRDV
jgi:hypothetical protein